MKFMFTDIQFEHEDFQVKGTDDIRLEELEKFYVETFQELYASRKIHLYFGRSEHREHQNIEGYASLCALQAIRIIPEKGFVSLAMQDNKIIALSECRYRENGKGSLKYIPHLMPGITYGDFSVLTSKNHRGKGLAQMLLLKTIDTAFSDRVTLIRSMIMNENEPSIKAHTSVRAKIKDFVDVSVINKSNSQIWEFSTNKENYKES